MDLNTISVLGQPWGRACRTERSGRRLSEGVGTVDVASPGGKPGAVGTPDCTKFTTGTARALESSGKHQARSITSFTAGERLVGPLQHVGRARGVKISLDDGGRIATACPASEDSIIHIFNSRDGDQLIAIKNPIPQLYPIGPILWSTFDSSTASGSQLAAEWQTHKNEIRSIALFADKKVIASSTVRVVPSHSGTHRHMSNWVFLRDLEMWYCLVARR